MSLTITLKNSVDVPIEVEGITPESVQSKRVSEVERLDVMVGNRRHPFAELFSLDGDPSDERMIWKGDLRGVHWIGAGMTRGDLRIEGDVGRHLGSGMRGGQILVEGDASDWVGAEMRGGLIQVRGSAGHLVGAVYRGGARGMSGGEILVQGSAGNEIGHTMRRGLIAVAGNADDLVGFNMLAGTILVLGSAGIRPGAGMKRGTIGLFGAETPELLHTFSHSCRYRPTFMTILWRRLEQLGFSPSDNAHVDCELYCGDLLEGGRGEILTRALRTEDR